MRRTLLMAVLVVGAGALAGCRSVYSDKPVGEKPVALTPSDWEGKWLCMGEWVTIRMLDAENGFLELRPVKPSPEGPLRVSIRESGEWRFANIQEPVPSIEGNEKEGEGKEDEEVKKEARYLWGRVENSDNQIIFWLPDMHKFEGLVEAGKIPGETDGDDLTLKGLTADHLNLIMSEKEGILFAWDEPMVLVREEPAAEAKEPASEEQAEDKIEE